MKTNNKITYINTYKNISSPQVIAEIDAYTYIHNLSNLDDITFKMVEEARYYYFEGKKHEYNTIKRQLPCYTLNFVFKDYKNNTNIIGPTGFMYLDIDGITNIDLSHSLIFASWRSLSNNGRGILVRVDGLTLDNFKYNYKAIAEELGLEADTNASKATQFTIQSYDEKVYFNDNSIVYKAITKELKNTTSVVLKKKEKDSTELVNKRPIRFNTINDYDFNDKDYIYYPDEKEDFYQIYIPFRIYDGNRNQTMYAIGCQFRGLNPLVTKSDVYNFLYNISVGHCKPKLTRNELSIIVNNVLKVENPIPLHVTERRILFNPNSDYSRIEKLTICNKITGRVKSERTYNILKEYILKWDFNTYPKINGPSLSKVSRRSLNNIYNYLKSLKLDEELVDAFKT